VALLAVLPGGERIEERGVEKLAMVLVKLPELAAEKLCGAAAQPRLRCQ
jgi:hypothetical protein